MSVDSNAKDKKYLGIILKRIEVCRSYKPQFGQGRATSLEEFHALYGSDPFYSWFGLDNALIYAAHKAAGGITSLYRQIGTGCEELFRHIVRERFGLKDDQVRWSYKIKASRSETRTLSLDGRIQLDDLRSEEEQNKIREWIGKAASEMGVNRKVARALKGALFEVRQRYKSKDSKRQNADIANAGTAYAQGYLPVALILSTQIDSDIAERYIGAGWLLLRGHLSESSTSSTYAFFKQVVGYDLAGFFKRNSGNIKQAVNDALKDLLKPDSSD